MDDDKVYITKDELRYIDSCINYPSLTRGDLFYLFGKDLETFEKSKTVQSELVRRKMLELDEARELKATKAYERDRIRDELESLKPRAVEVMKEMLYSKDKKLKFDAAKKVLEDDYAYLKRTSEVKAESDAFRKDTDEPYLEPSGAADSLE